MILTNTDNRAEYRREFKLAQVTLDGTGTYEAYVLANEHWNGWSIPYFTRETADKWLTDQNALEQTEGMKQSYYDAARDAYVTYSDIDPDAENPDQQINGAVDFQDESGNPLHLYCINGWYWCWFE